MEGVKLEKNSSLVSSVDVEALFELAQLYRMRGDFRKAIEKFQHLSKICLKQKNKTLYLECVHYLLRLHSERDETNKIDTLKQKLQDLVIRGQLDLTARTYYTLGMCSAHREQYDMGLECLEKALSMALEKNNKKDILYAVVGLGIIYNHQGKAAKALQEVEKAKVLLQAVEDVSELKLSTQLLEVQALMNLKRDDEAQDVLWSCYEHLRHEKNFFIYLNLLFTMGKTYLAMGDEETAGLYFQLAQSATDPDEMLRFAKHVNKELALIGRSKRPAYDIILNEAKKTLLERDKGEVSFKHRFVVLDLLKAFLRRPGHVYSKEQLVEQVWKQPYDPSVHDNKLYVSIKRLRRMIESDYDKPRYIFRAKQGYYLNKNVRVRIR